MTLTTAEDTPVSGKVDAHDATGKVLAIEIGAPQHGTATQSGNVVTYTPAANYNGTDSISVHVSDGMKTADTQIQITITPVNDPPAAGNLSLAAVEDTPLVTAQSTLIAQASDVDSDSLTISDVGGAMHGAVAITGSDVTFTPELNYNGTASYQFTVSDGKAGAVGTVTITVGGVNDPPVGVDDVVTTPEDTPLVVAGTALAANDTDAEHQTLTVTAVANPVHGTVALDSGTVTFTPDPDFNGAAGFDYTVSDGAATGTGHVTVNVTSVDDGPTAVDDTLSGVEDTLQTIPSATLTANDTDIDTDPASLTVTAVDNAINCTVSVSRGTVTFTPAANFSGTATFDYTVSDGTLTSIAHVTVAVAAVNDAPVAVDDTVDATEDAPQTILGAGLLANDTDIEGDTLTITAVGNATHCTVSLVGGNVSFTPDRDFNGNATFEYTVSDGAATDIGAVTVAIAPVNDAPVAVDDLATTELNTTIQIDTADLLRNDIDVDGPTLSVTAVQNPQHGTVDLTGTTITFTPETDFIGPASFDYVVSDGSLTDIGQVAVTVFTTSVCGDGQVTGLEKCDDGNTTPGDGCSATCKIEAGFACNGQPSVCNAICGDRIIVGAETCDDGNTSPGDGCSATCTTEPGFACNGQPSVCNTICGDGLIVGTEICDDGNTSPGDGCSAVCKIESGWVCSGQPSACNTVCGDHITAGTETCDDGNTISGDGCSATCKREFCGDGTTNNNGSEECDDGNADDTDGCTTQCVKAVVCNATQQPNGDTFKVDPATGHCYVSFSNKTTFTAAENACVALGGYLATISGTGEEAFVDAAQNPAQSPWLGASDDANTTDDVFVWVTGEPWSYKHFASGEPDNDAATGGNGDCIHIANAAGEWADTTCASTSTFERICEFDPAPCGDGVLQTVNGEQCDDGNVIDGDGCSATCQLETLVTFSFTGAVGTEATFPADGASPAPGLDAIPVMGRGPGVVHTTTAKDVFIGTAWNTAALDTTKYYTFTVTPAAAFTMSFSSLALDNQRSNTGPTTFVIRSSLDNFAADLGTFTTPPGGTLGHTKLSLGAVFKNLTTPVEFRLFAFGASSSAGTWRVDNVVLSGTTQGP